MRARLSVAPAVQAVLRSVCFLFILFCLPLRDFDCRESVCSEVRHRDRRDLRSFPNALELTPPLCQVSLTDRWRWSELFRIHPWCSFGAFFAVFPGRCVVLERGLVRCSAPCLRMACARIGTSEDVIVQMLLSDTKSCAASGDNSLL